MSVSRQERLLKPWPRSPRQWSRAQGSAAEAQASGQGHIGQQRPMKKRERALQREKGSGIGSWATQITRYLSQITQITQITQGCFFLERGKGGDHKQSFSQEHFCSFVLFLFTSVVYVQLHA